jgi:hypothetical protein
MHRIFSKGVQMHIHGAPPNLGLSLHSSGLSNAELSAQQAAATRKKLLASASGLEATSSPESAWMITAWGGGNSQGGQGKSYNDSPRSSEPGNGKENYQPAAPASAAAPVSFWA